MAASSGPIHREAYSSEGRYQQIGHAPALDAMEALTGQPSAGGGPEHEDMPHFSDGVAISVWTAEPRARSRHARWS